MTTRQRAPIVTLAMQRFDRSAPLLDRLVRMENVMVMEVPGTVGWKGVIDGVFDAVEMPIGGYMLRLEQGYPLTAVPVFPDRVFVQQYVYVRRDSDIKSLADLRGRRVALAQYNMAASFWHRGILKEDYGIAPEEIEWHTSSPEAWESTLPPGVSVTMKPGSFIGLGLLLDGTADCLMTEGTPMTTAEERKQFRRLHDDVAGLQRDFYRRTGSHVITHLIVVRKDALEKRPELGEVLCRAYDEAKAQIYRTLQNERQVSLPLMRTYLDETVELFGDDPWPYGLEANRGALEKFLFYAHDQGLTNRQYSAEEIFDRRSLSYEFTARMAEGSFP